MIHAPINVNTSGLSTLVVNDSSAVRVNVYELYLFIDDSVNVTLGSVNYGSGTGTLSLGVALTGPLPLKRGSSLALPLNERENGVRIPYFQTEFGDNLTIDLSADVQVSGWMRYTIESLGDA